MKWDIIKKNFNYYVISEIFLFFLITCIFIGLICALIKTAYFPSQNQINYGTPVFLVIFIAFTFLIGWTEYNILKKQILKVSAKDQIILDVEKQYNGLKNTQLNKKLKKVSML